MACLAEAHTRKAGTPKGCAKAGGSAWESNPLRRLILKDLRHFRILPILGFLSFAAVNPQIAPSEERA